MRKLGLPPSELRNPPPKPEGSYAGHLPRLDIQASSFAQRVTRDKRWVFAFAASDDVAIAASVVKTGYAHKAFAYGVDLVGRRLLFQRSVTAPPGIARFVDDGPRTREASFSFGGLSLRVGDAGIAISTRTKALFGDPVVVRCDADLAGATRPISAFVPVDDGGVSATEKYLAPATLDVSIAGARRNPVAASFGVDHSRGLLARHTAWRWGFGVGRAASGEMIGFNVVSGFVGEAECAAFAWGDVVPLAEADFTVSGPFATAPAQVKTRCGSLDVHFSPCAAMSEQVSLGLVRSELVQSVGTFRGRLAVDGVSRDLDLVGMIEHHDAVW